LSRFLGRQVFSNLSAILEVEKLTFADVVKVTLYLKDMNDFAEVNGIYREYFPADPPARVCVEVARLPREVTVEMDLIAVYPS